MSHLVHSTPITCEWWGQEPQKEVLLHYSQAFTFFHTSHLLLTYLLYSNTYFTGVLEG